MRSRKPAPKIPAKTASRRAVKRAPPLPTPIRTTGPDAGGSPRHKGPLTRSSQTPKQSDLLGSTPLPVRITAEQQAQLAAKRDRTGVPIQELVRRAIDHMLTTVEIAAVPERR